MSGKPSALFVSVQNAGKLHEGWVLEDSAGKGVESVRPIRDETKGSVRALIGEILPR